MFTYLGNVLGRNLLGKAQPEGIHITNFSIKGQTCLSLNPQTKQKSQGHITIHTLGNKTVLFIT